jgi:ankyrin repeat protein
MRLQFIQILFASVLLFTSGSAYSQSPDNAFAYYDTTDYIPSFFEAALNYDLMIAASRGYILEIDRLIKKGADVNSETEEGVTPIVYAVSNNRTKIAKMLIDYGADLNKLTARYETPLIIAVKNQNEEITEALIRGGADLDLTDNYDATPLHYASVYGYLQLVDLLLYYDVSIDKKTVEGTTPLLAAVWAENADVADLLIQKGANMETRDAEGFTPFLMAALNGDTLIMRLLYEKGVDIYAVNASNNNALTLAIIADHTDAALFLLRIGDKWAGQGSYSVSPYSVASKYRRKEIINLLKERKMPGNIKYEIDQVDIMASSKFFLHDFYTGVSLTFKEPYLNGGIILGCDTKIWYTRVLIKNSEHTFYQYMNKGSVFYAGLFKDFALTDNAFKANYELSTSLSAGYSFGNKLKGTLLAPGNKFMVIPAISLKWTKKDLSFSIGADYMKTEFYRTGPVWIRIGASYNIYFDNIRTKRKTLKWY